MKKYDIRNTYNVAIYARYSSKRQRDTSIEQQIDEIRTLIKKLKLPWQVVRIYADRGVSGRKTGREQLRKMQADLRAGIVRADLVLVTDLDRLSRAKRGGGIRANLEKIGVAVTTSKSGFADPTSSEAELMANVNEYRAREENILKGVRVKWAKINLAKQGFWPGGPPPLGMRLVPVDTGGDRTNSRLAHDPQTAWIVVRMFAVAQEEAMGPHRIARSLNADPDVSKAVGAMTESQVRSVLQNPIYIGTLEYNELSTEIVDDTCVRTKNAPNEVVIVENVCEPLIERPVWDTVQEQFAVRATGSQNSEDSPGIMSTRHHVPLKRCLAGLAICAECGSSMHGVRSGDYKAADGSHRQYCYYTCPRRRSGCCKNDVSVPAEWIEEHVVTTLLKELFGLDENATSDNSCLDREALSGSDVLDELCREIQAAIETMVEDGASPCDSLEAEREQLIASKAGHLKSLGNANLDDSVREALTEEMAATVKRLKEIEGELALQAARDDALRTVVNRDRVLDQLCDFYRIITTKSASAINILLHHHIDRIECFPDGRVRTIWTRLGIMGGREIEAFLAWFAAEECEDGEDHERPEGWIKPRRRAARKIGMEIEDFEEAQAANEFAIDPHRFEGLDIRWFIVTETTVPVPKCWAEEHAKEVAEFRLESGLSMEKTAAHFGVTSPTIRHALKVAQEQYGIDAFGKKVSRKTLPNWSKENAQVVLEYIESTGSTLKAIAEHFDKSQPTISKALKIARAEREQVSSEDDPDAADAA